MLVFFVFAEIHFENLSAPLREPQCPASRASVPRFESLSAPLREPQCPASRASVPHFEIFSAPLREPISALREPQCPRDPQWPTSRAYKCTSRASVPTRTSVRRFESLSGRLREPQCPTSRTSVRRFENLSGHENIQCPASRASVPRFESV